MRRQRQQSQRCRGHTQLTNGVYTPRRRPYLLPRCNNAESYTTAVVSLWESIYSAESQPILAIINVNSAVASFCTTSRVGRFNRSSRCRCRVCKAVPSPSLVLQAVITYEKLSTLNVWMVITPATYEKAMRAAWPSSYVAITSFNLRRRARLLESTTASDVAASIIRHSLGRIVSQNASSMASNTTIRLVRP